MLKRILSCASLALLMSCGDSGTGVVVIPGLLTFTYSGGISGSYSASGTIPATPAAQMTNAWSAAEVSTPNGATFVMSALPRNATSHDFVDLWINRTTTGTETLDPACSFNCTSMMAIFGVNNTNESTFIQLCWMETGSITITEISATRVKGTFSGTGHCYTPANAETTFTVTGGTFDVAVVPSLSS